MGSSRHGASDTNQWIRLPVIVRAVRIILRYYALTIAFQHLLDRIRPDFSRLLCRSVFGKGPRRRLLPLCSDRRIYSSSPRYLYDIHIDTILANISCPGYLQRLRRRARVLSHCVSCCNVFHEEALPSHGIYRLRWGYWRDNFSFDFPAA